MIWLSCTGYEMRISMPSVTLVPRHPPSAAGIMPICPLPELLGLTDVTSNAGCTAALVAGDCERLAAAAFATSLLQFRQTGFDVLLESRPGIARNRVCARSLGAFITPTADRGGDCASRGQREQRLFRRRSARRGHRSS